MHDASSARATPAQPLPADGDGSAMTPGDAFIAADVGGTHARIGQVRMGDGGRIEVLDFHQYAGAGWPSLAAILRDFAGRSGRGAAHVVVAIAGRLDGDALVNANLPWPVSVAHTRREAGIGQLVLLNDFEAVACAMPFIDPAAMTRVCGPDRIGAGPALVLGPGTGSATSAAFLPVPTMVIPSGRQTMSAFCLAASSIKAANCSRFCSGLLFRGR